MAIFWILVFIASMAALVKGADWFLKSAEKIGLAAGLSPFIIGVTIVGIGTSFPELISSLAATFKDATEIVAANVVGSNIANILLIVGFAAVLGRRLVVTKNLIDLDLPLLAINTVIFLGTAWDGVINFSEAILLLLAYGIYLLYTIFHKEEGEHELHGKKLPSRRERRAHLIDKELIEKPKLVVMDFIWLGFGLLGLVIGAKYLIDAVIELSKLLNIATGVITISAVALGTSLPELIVSAKAALQKKSEVAIGNIFGSNVFNALIVIGIPALIKDIRFDEPTFLLGLPTMIAATLLFVISGISRRIHLWEGSFYLLLYALFVAKLFNLF
ncbi:MAG TPA: calcium/sodium antiporter [Candidatus Paceibacterota bacterium]|nr:calcium/sodium antiporter [Candidatus Paceibacterota bacterium]